MTHEELIVEVAKRLEWPEERTAGIVETILELVSAELKMNNPVLLEDFGILKTDIQQEYILVDTETGERYLMPPAMEVIFESLFQENEDNTSLPAFSSDEALFDEINNSFSQFEPTLLNEGVQFPGMLEIVAEEEKEEEKKEEEEEEESEPIIEHLAPPEIRSRRGVKSDKKIPSVWVPIAGGIAIVLVSLFFFKDVTNRKSA